MKTIHSKLWSVASGNQTVSGGGGSGHGCGGGRDQNRLGIQLIVLNFFWLIL
jgi:hypothetical protein